MAMPGRPAAPMGAEGQINVPNPFETHEAVDAGLEAGDDRPSVPVGPVNDYGPEDPMHGAAGGLDVSFETVAPVEFVPPESNADRQSVLDRDLGIR